MMISCDQVYSKAVGTFSVLLLIVGLVACSSVSPQKKLSEPDNAALGRASVVSMGSLNLNPQQPSTISWLSPIDVVGSSDDARSASLKVMTKSAVERQITRKGYPVVPVAGDYQMKALLVLGGADLENQTFTNSLPRSELLQKTGIDPGLVGGQLAQGKGSLVIELRQGRALRWRGAVQIYVLLDSDASIAAQRIEHAVAQLLLTWP